MPKSKVAFWQTKLRGNKKRDAAVRRQLKKIGWSVLVVWECQTTEAKKKYLKRQVLRFLNGTAS
jgi:DNA mismatch endonuclease (patch repair protein)